MNIFITGGTGFIGRNLSEFLSEKYRVLAPSHKELELLDEDAVRNFFLKNNVDVVIHSAVRPGHRNAKDPSNQLYNNSRMFFNIARNSDKFKKMIFLNSGLVYDIKHYLPKMKEEYFDNHVPADEGGFSKYIAAKYIENTRNIVELRVFGIFGKYEDYAIRFISNAICKTLFDLPITIKQNRKFDYISVNDFMPIIEHFIKNSPAHKAFNVSPSSSIELLELAKIVKEISGKNLPIKIAAEGLGVEYSGDNTRLMREISGLKFTDIKKSIAELYKWYETNKSSIDVNRLMTDK